MKIKKYNNNLNVKLNKCVMIGCKCVQFEQPDVSINSFYMKNVILFYEKAFFILNEFL